MFVISYFAIDTRSIKGEIGHRYVGLYGSIIRALEAKSKVYWYSIRDSTLRVIRDFIVSKRSFGLFRAGLRAVSETLNAGRRLAVIIAYPYAIPKSPRVLEYFALIFLLKLFSLAKRVCFWVDDFDPPVEAMYNFSEGKPSALHVVYYRLRDLLTLKLAPFIVAVSESYRQYVSRIYRVREERIFVVPNGCLVEYVGQLPLGTVFWFSVEGQGC